MLTALELKDFKGIGERQRIEFRPLTLLFGPNSAGKSTVLQALLYLHEIIVHGDADVGRTNLGGQVVDLGGFQRLINGHDTSRAITLRAEFTTGGILDRFQRDPPDFPLPDLEDELDAAWLEITVRWRATAGHVGPVVERATLGAGNDREPIHDAIGGQLAQDYDLAVEELVALDGEVPSVEGAQPPGQRDE